MNSSTSCFRRTNLVGTLEDLVKPCDERPGPGVLFCNERAGIVLRFGVVNRPLKPTVRRVDDDEAGPRAVEGRPRVCETVGRLRETGTDPRLHHDEEL